jgi:ribosomal protein S18 acetylase RimI-like enzyme
MKIVEAESWSQYLESWMACMGDTYWFNESLFFDYSREEVTDELRRDWEAGGVFLTAHGDEGVVGCLGVRLRGKSGVVRRWEPAVPARFRDLGVGERLLGEATRRAKAAGAETLLTTLRYPYGMDKPWLSGLYESMGFRDARPGVQLLARLGETEDAEPSTGYDTVPCGSFTLDELTEFTLRAFASTPEDRAIHGDNSKVSQPEEARKAIEHQMAGGLGESPEELNMVAFVDGEPAGFTRGIIVEDGYKPRYGLLAVLGVFPEYREKGVGYYLTAELLARFRARGLEYAFVGTPWNDYGAQRLYARAWFRPVHWISFYRKELG